MMYFRMLICLSIVFSTLFGIPALTQNDVQPTLAFLLYGHTSGFELARQGFLDVMDAYGFFSDDERVVLNEAQDLDGDRVNVIWGDADRDLPTANLLVEQALDRGATLLVTMGTPITQIAVSISNDMDEPLPVVFSIVGAPYSAGIAQAPCVKPDFVAGTRATYPRDEVVALVPLQNPDADAIGVMINAAEANSVKSAGDITSHGEALGLTALAGPIATASDLPVALESLLDKGADAIFATGYIDSSGLPALLGPALEAGVPVIGLSPSVAKRGAPIGAGFNSFYREGVVAGRIIANYLNGDVDLSTLAINEIPELSVALNLDVAAEYGFEFSDAMLERADFVFENGESTEDTTPPKLPDLNYEELREADLEFLAGLECTAEIIAEQQAALDAASE